MMKKNFIIKNMERKKENEVINSFIVIFRDATEWGSSISVRTPNDEEKELIMSFQ